MSNVEYLAICLIAAWVILGVATLCACLICSLSLRFLAFSRGYLVDMNGGQIFICDERSNVVLRTWSSSYARQWLRLH